ncbi:MAG: 50S ribosomal protein L24 [bacterium]
MKIKKNDKVKIITGKDKGKSGKVVRVLVKENKVIIEGLNMMKKHQRPRKSGEKGNMVNLAMPIDASNVKKVE